MCTPYSILVNHDNDNTSTVFRVTDANDNSPVFIGSPYSVNVSEAALVGSQVAELLAVDIDQPGPLSSVRYRLLPGPHSHLLSLQSPLSGSLALARPLDYEGTIIHIDTVNSDGKLHVMTILSSSRTRVTHVC